MQEPLEAWQDAVSQAWILAYGERKNELNDERRARLLDDRGLHPYSEVWGRIHYLEGVPGVAIEDGDNRKLQVGDYEYVAGKVTPFELKEAARKKATQDWLQVVPPDAD
jgi:hypothetical protein